ncbi:MAG: quinol dehydrogenase ferredoxin subunit NapH [Gammaproteobacteria bacterium]|uniref:Quinol dehydrogenase ferredoxin subunit NapH n=1 Tax=Candidatus Thiopontia autotrophica TaxID=2841688 RepID=A0A8J6PES1_9GAMM|nr:quinol dehydrogenase ferredoxin subunit NapH [Candidatus Thiopontia autotrophica]
MARDSIGKAAVEEKGWIRSHKWLVMRRISQLSIIALFLVGSATTLNALDEWGEPVRIIKGNLVSSLVLDTVPLTDPFVYLQTLFAGHAFETTALVGALIVVLFYLAVGGRVYCSWVCPMNMVTDAAAWLRRKLGLKKRCELSPNIRFWVLGMVMVMSLLSGTLLWELVNPVTLLQRSILYGFGIGWVAVGGIFLYDLLWSRNGWCGHICPMGAFYSLLGKLSLVRVRAADREACNDCMDCFAVCPEPQVLRIPLKGEDGTSNIVNYSQCTNCGRCVDVCGPDVFRFGGRFGDNMR